MPDDLYDRDILIWSEQQAELLRRLAVGERVNDAVDWTNLIEEVESVGRSEFHACRSLLAHAFVHLLKLRAWPGSQAAAHWRGEVVSFLTSARRRHTPSMRQRIDLAELYADALFELQAWTGDTGQPLPSPQTCPFTLDDLLSGRPNVWDLVAKLFAAA